MVQYAGLIAERWFFLAQANHPQNLYSFLDVPGGESATKTNALAKVLEAYPDTKLQTEKQFVNNRLAALGKTAA